MRTPLALISIIALAIGATITTATPSDTDDTLLQESMSEVNSGLRSFRKALKGGPANKEAALSQLLSMQSAVQKAKVEVPEKAEGEDAAEGRALTIAFRKDLIELQKELLGLEVSILDDDFKSADGGIRRLLEMKKAGHDKYIEGA